MGKQNNSHRETWPILPYFPVRDIQFRCERRFLGVPLTSGTYDFFFAFYISRDFLEHIKANNPFLSVEKFFHNYFKFMFFWAGARTQLATTQSGCQFGYMRSSRTSLYSFFNEFFLQLRGCQKRLDTVHISKHWANRNIGHTTLLFVKVSLYSLLH